MDKTSNDLVLWFQKKQHPGELTNFYPKTWRFGSNDFPFPSGDFLMKHVYPGRKSVLGGTQQKNPGAESSKHEK